MTKQEFIEDAPPYTRIAIIGFRPPKSITRMCNVCKKETTWTMTALTNVHAEISFHAVGYRLKLESFNFEIQSGCENGARSRPRGMG